MVFHPSGTVLNYLELKTHRIQQIIDSLPPCCTFQLMLHVAGAVEAPRHTLNSEKLIPTP